MKLEPRFLPEMAEIIMRSVHGKIKESGRKGAIIGLSGGIDSAVVAKLCLDSLGKNRVLCIIMPTDNGDTKTTAEAVELAHEVGLRHKIIDLSEALTVMKAALHPNIKRTGNLKARLRMITLYDLAAKEGLLVMGTGNKSELLVGYYTKYGDGASDLLPIGDLYKTQVRALAKHLGIPARVIKKVPTAGLWEGQTDEGQLGIPYTKLDQVLVGIEHRLSDKVISKGAGVPPKEVDRIRQMVMGCRHKREPIRIPKIGVRTIGLDWKD